MNTVSALELKEKFEAALDALYAPPENGSSEHALLLRMRTELCEAQRYPLAPASSLGSGYSAKRIRPLLLLCSAGAAGGNAAMTTAITAALAAELVHTYSLVHDDLPCMDNDDYRRGRLTTHKVYGEAKALLVGDGLLPRAFEILAAIDGTGERPSLSRLACVLGRCLAHAAGAESMVLGQWIDLHLTNTEIEVPQEVLFQMHGWKTGKLLGASLEMGVLCGLAAALDDDFYPARPENVALATAARNAGETAGLAFQVIDDILDFTQSSDALGKTAGKDAQQSKATAVTLLGLPAARKFAAELTGRAEELTLQVFENKRLEKNAETSSFRSVLLELLQGLLHRAS